MSFQMGRGFLNPLLQRVRRHSSISTLFRTPSEPQPANLLTPVSQTHTNSIDSLGVVQATLGGIEGATSPISATGPVSQIQGTLRTPRVRQVPAESTTETVGVRPAVPTPSISPSPSSAATPVTSDPGTITPQPGETETTILPDSGTRGVEADSSITDSVWQRLQTIFRRHQKPPASSQQAGDMESDSSTEQDLTHPPLTPPVDEALSQSESTPTRETTTPEQTHSPGQSVPRPAARILRSLEPGNVSQPTDVSHSETDSEGEVTSLLPSDSILSPVSVERIDLTAPGQLSPGVTSPDQAVVPEIPQPDGDSIHQIIPLSSTTPSTPTSPVRTGDAKTDTADLRSQRAPAQFSKQQQDSKLETLPVAQNNNIVQPSPTTPAIQRMTDSPVQQVPGMEDSVAEKPPHDLKAAPEEISQIGVDTSQQTTPLQDVWQVERLPQPPASAALREVPLSIQQDGRSPDNGLQENISRVLDSVASGRPTSSSIEVVAPRHPRPVPLQVSRRPQQPTIMREPAAPQDHQQRIISAQDSTLPEVEAVVDTAIGPLPADLWTLIDEPVPSGVRRQHSHVERDIETTDRAESASQLQLDRQVRVETPPIQAAFPQLRQDRESQVPRSSSLPSVSTVTQTPSRIQRVAEQTGGDTSTSAVEQRRSTDQDAGTSSQEQQQDESEAEERGVDIDDLARKVYAEVKRKLTVEWERLRTRF